MANVKAATEEKPIKVGAKVSFSIKTGHSQTDGEGKVTAQPPEGAGRGAKRYTVIDKNGREWHPFRKQISLA